jgi:uncharacterized protein YwlG (UPF0340 family)
MDNEQTLVEAIARVRLPDGTQLGPRACEKIARAILPIARKHLMDEAAGIAKGCPSPFVGAGGWDKQDEGFLAAKEDIDEAIRAAGEPK